VAHELVYRTENLAELDMAEYLGDLAEHLVTARRRMGAPVSLQPAIEAASVGLDTAIPLGFILIEWVTNSLQHAFPDGRSGIVTVALCSLGAGRMELSVSDDGVGLPEHVNPDEPASLGFSLVKTLAKQIGGETEYSGDNGTRATIRFQEAARSG
jgi:two-component sensor histidine kinase